MKKPYHHFILENSEPLTILQSSSLNIQPLGIDERTLKTIGKIIFRTQHILLRGGDKPFKRKNVRLVKVLFVLDLYYLEIKSSYQSSIRTQIKLEYIEIQVIEDSDDNEMNEGHHGRNQRKMEIKLINHVQVQTQK